MRLSRRGSLPFRSRRRNTGFIARRRRKLLQMWYCRHYTYAKSLCQPPLSGTKLDTLHKVLLRRFTIQNRLNEPKRLSARRRLTGHFMGILMEKRRKFAEKSNNFVTFPFNKYHLLPFLAFNSRILAKVENFVQPAEIIHSPVEERAVFSPFSP